MSTPLVDQLQVWGFDGEIIIFSDGSLGFGLNATQTDISCLADEDVNAMAEHEIQFLNGLPTGLDIQFVQTISRDNSAMIGISLSKRPSRKDGNGSDDEAITSGVANTETLLAEERTVVRAV